MCWSILGFFAFVTWTPTTESETALALACFPVWFLVLAIGWAVVRRRPERTQQYLRFQEDMKRPVDVPLRVNRRCPIERKRTSDDNPR